MTDHEALIEALSRSAAPIRRPLPAPLRALVWGALAIASGWLATTGLRAPLTAWTADDGWGLAQLALSLALGVAALASAFETSIPGPRRRTAPVLVLGLAAWLVVGVINVSVTDAPAGSFGDGVYCFRFLVTSSLPMAALVVIGLRSTGSLAPGRTLAAAGIGVAALSASMLALCHPFGLARVDFLMHIAAIVGVVAATIVLGRRWIDWPTRDRRAPTT